MTANPVPQRSRRTAQSLDRSDQKSNFCVLVLLLIALAIRAYGISAWLPDAFLGPDDKLYVLSGMEILEGMAPRNIEDGSLYVFLLSAVYLFYFLLTNFASILSSLASQDMGRLMALMNDYFIAFYRDPWCWWVDQAVLILLHL